MVEGIPIRNADWVLSSKEHNFPQLFGFLQNTQHLPARVRPGAELEVALLVVKGEPGDVNLAGGLEEAGGHVEATAVTAHNHIRLVSPIKLLVGAECANEAVKM